MKLTRNILSIHYNHNQSHKYEFHLNDKSHIVPLKICNFESLDKWNVLKLVRDNIKVLLLNRLINETD